MRVKPIIGSMIIAALFIALTGCYFFLPTHTASSREFYSSDGVTAIAVTNITGNVTINQGTGDSIVIQALKRGYSPEELELVQIKVTEGTTLTVVSDYSNDPMSGVSVDYTITLPADITVSVQNITGNVSVDGITSVGVLSVVTGDIEVIHCERVSELQSTTGCIDVEIERTEGDVTIKTTTGNITAWVEPDVNAMLYPSWVTGSYSGPNLTPYGYYRINLSVVTGNITVYNL